MGRSYDALERVRVARSGVVNDSLIAWAIIYLALTIEELFEKPSRLQVETDKEKADAAE